MEALGELQLQVMEIVWQMGQATVAEVHEALARQREIAYTTVLTTMRALERRGMLDHTSVGKAYQYRPLISRDEYTAASVDRLVDNLFQGKQDKLLCHLLGAKRIDKADLSDIRRMIAEKRKGQQ